MGYTHYWSRDKAEIPLPLWRKAIAKIRPILEQNAEILEDVEVTDSVVFFNGQCETFVMPRIATPGCDETRTLGNMGDFCKTAERDYDPVVVACLVILTSTLKGTPVGFTWASDGKWPKDHESGLKLSGLPALEAVGPV